MESARITSSASLGENYPDLPRTAKTHPRYPPSAQNRPPSTPYSNALRSEKSSTARANSTDDASINARNSYPAESANYTSARSAAGRSDDDG